MGVSINPIRKGAQVEVKLTNTNVGSTFTFPDISYLRGVQITEFEVISAAQQTTSPGGNTVIAQADLLGIVVTLAVQGSQQDIVNMPVKLLEASANGGATRAVNNKVVNFPRSFVTIVNAGTLAANQSVCFMFYYN
jgi:hypothetical protein